MRGNPGFARPCCPGAVFEAQVTHHAAVRELLFGGLEGDDIERLAAIYERAMPGVLDAPQWPVPAEQRR